MECWLSSAVLIRDRSVTRGGITRQKLFGECGGEAMNVLTNKVYKGCFDYDQEADLFHGQIVNLADRYRHLPGAFH